MLILWIPLGIFLLYWLWQRIFLEIWDKGLSAVLTFKERAVTEGETATLIYEVTNRKRLPLPVVRLQFAMSSGLVAEDNPNASVSDRTNVVEYFTMGGYEAVTREQNLTAKKRGYYQILGTSFVVPGLFDRRAGYKDITQFTDLYVQPKMLPADAMDDAWEQILGEVIARKRLYEDVFTFRGIREYAPSDPMRSVNWKASARAGQLMVNLREHTSGQEIRILLNLEEPAVYYDPEILEYSIRLAFTLAGRCIDGRIPVGLISNGRDCMTDQEIRIAGGGSPEHLGTIAEALTRVALEKGAGPFFELVENEALTERAENVTYCLISSSRDGRLMKAAGRLASVQGGLLWLCPLMESMLDVAVPENIHFIRMDWSRAW